MPDMDFDTLLTGARIVDGTGNPWFHGEIGWKGDRIAAIAPPGVLSVCEAARTIDVGGMVVCPGFIDIQSHSLAPLLTDGRSLSKVTQGVTTEILGELWTPAPFGGRRKAALSGWDVAPKVAAEADGWKRFGDWIESYARRGVSVNVGSFVGGGTVREWACGWDASPATPEQVEEMRRVVSEAMEDGAFGIAPALIYPPNAFSTDDELTACATEVARHGGLYIVHLRSEGDGLLESVDATARLSRESGCPVEIYHLKASGERNWHKMESAIAAIDGHRASGIDVTADMYPYVASGTGLNVLVPNWASEGGRLFENLRDPDTRRRIHDAMVAPDAATGDFAGTDRAGHVMPVGFKRPEHQGFVGMRLSRIAEAMGRDWADAAIELLLAENQRIATFFFSMCEDNVRLQMRQPWVSISTDAGGMDPEALPGPVHPRAFGTYPRVLGKYVREEKVLTLEDAVRKMTSAVAARLNLRERGALRVGAFADIVAFDPETIADRATFEASNRLSVGVEHVWVNGAAVVTGRRHTGATPGRTVFGAGRK